MPSTPDLQPEQLIHALNLQPLIPEGGWFRQTYLSAEEIPAQALPERYPRTDKPFGSVIFYLLTDEPGSFSALHRLPTDEIYHFYLGDPLELTLLYPDGSSRQVILGQDVLNGQQLQALAPRGVWQGSRVAPGGRYALVGTTMAPAYTDDDYEAAQRELLLAQYPAARERILELTRV